MLEGTSMGTPEVRQAAQEKKHRVETWKACKKLLKTPNLLRQLRFFTDAMAPVDGAGARRLRRMYSDEYRDGSKLLSEAMSMSASTVKSSKGKPETVNEDDDESHTTHLTGDSQMTKPPEYDSDGYEIPDESHLPESERTTPEDREAAKGVRRAAVRARAVADTPPFFEVEGSSNMSDASTTSSTVDGYQIVGVLALWANAHIASIEAKSCVRDLDEQERGLRARFDLSREPEMLVAKRDAYVAASRVKMIEREVEQLEKEVKHRQNRVVAWEGKVRVARVLQQYTPGGHSLLTWACCLGISSVVETLLDHGSCPGLPDVVEAEAARVVQLVYRHHVWRSAERVRVARSEQANSASEKAARRKRETEFKFILQRALTVYMDKRTTHRLPLCEAAYNRNGNVFEAFERRRILYTGRHLYETALYPEPPFPFARRPPVAAHLRKRLYNVVDCVEHGIRVPAARRELRPLRVDGALRGARAPQEGRVPRAHGPLPEPRVLQVPAAEPDAPPRRADVPEAFGAVPPGLRHGDARAAHRQAHVRAVQPAPRRLPPGLRHGAPGLRGVEPHREIVREALHVGAENGRQDRRQVRCF